MSREPAKSRPAGPTEWLIDAAIATFLTFVSLSILFSLLERRPDRSMGVAAALLVAHAGALVFRRRAPVGVFGFNLLSGIAVWVVGFPTVVLGVAPLVALYSVASRCDRRRSLPALTALAVAMIATLGLDTSVDASTVVGNLIVLSVVWFLGDSHRSRRVYVEELEQRTAELERARSELATRAVAEERLRIARELHDVIAHNVSLIAVQASAGAHVIDERPDEAKRSLEAIRDTSRSTLAETRRVLGMIRSNGDAPETEPAPRLADLESLATDLERVGIDVDLRVEPPPPWLPAGIELAAFRIVQEALTNVVKHANARRVRIALWYADGELRLEVVDDGIGASDMSVGHGITGMRERAGLRGGTFEASGLPEGGFRVTAALPIEVSG